MAKQLFRDGTEVVGFYVRTVKSGPFVFVSGTTSLDRVVPQPFRLHAHHWLILHGRYVCKARKPECWRCVVADLCRYKPKTPPPQGRAE